MFNTLDLHSFAEWCGVLSFLLGFSTVTLNFQNELLPKDDLDRSIVSEQHCRFILQKNQVVYIYILHITCAPIGL